MLVKLAPGSANLIQIPDPLACTITILCSKMMPIELSENRVTRLDNVLLIGLFLDANCDFLKI
jgi:hypothetical protein